MYIRHLFRCGQQYSRCGQIIPTKIYNNNNNNNNRRVRLILRTELNGRNKMEAINSLAVPVVQYSIGNIDWKISELKKIDTKTRKLLNMHKMLHPKADVGKLYLPRKDGGRGLIEVETAFKAATIGLDH